MTSNEAYRGQPSTYERDASAWQKRTYRTPKLTHSPGPFSCFRNTDGCDDCFDIYAAGDDRRLVSIYFWDDPDTSAAAQAEADANLLTAAPELLAALRSADLTLSAVLGRNCDGGKLASLIRRAIDRAEGRGNQNASGAEENE